MRTRFCKRLDKCLSKFTFMTSVSRGVAQDDEQEEQSGKDEALDAETVKQGETTALFTHCSSKWHFKFDGQYNDQVDDVAMGSPLGSVLANIFMCHFEEQCIAILFAPYSKWRKTRNRIEMTVSSDISRKMEKPFLDLFVERTYAPPLLQSRAWRRHYIFTLSPLP